MVFSLLSGKCAGVSHGPTPLRIVMVQPALLLRGAARGAAALLSARQDGHYQGEGPERDAVPGEDTDAAAADKADERAHDEERADEGDDKADRDRRRGGQG